MATLQSDEANILDAETINWRLIVYPILAALIVVVGGFGYYYYQQVQRDISGGHRARGPAEGHHPGRAGEGGRSISQDRPGDAGVAERGGRFLCQTGLRRSHPELSAGPRHAPARTRCCATRRNSGWLPLSKPAARWTRRSTPISRWPIAATRLPTRPSATMPWPGSTTQRGDKDNERKILNEEASLDSDSQFVKEAQFKLKEHERRLQSTCRCKALSLFPHRSPGLQTSDSHQTAGRFSGWAGLIHALGDRGLPPVCTDGFIDRRSYPLKYRDCAR